MSLEANENKEYILNARCGPNVGTTFLNDRTRTIKLCDNGKRSPPVDARDTLVGF